MSIHEGFPYKNRDLSWLSFNERVLQEAEDPHLPLVERLKFLGIFSSNLDEFFRVRVATNKRLAELGRNISKEIVGDPREVLTEIHNTVVELRSRSERIYQDIIHQLATRNIYLIDENQVAPGQSQFIREHFREHILPGLVPIMLDNVDQFPHLRDRTIYLAVHMQEGKDQHPNRYALIELPEHQPRFLVLPSETEATYIMILDDIIRYCMDEIFHMFSFRRYRAYTIKLTRDAEMAMDQDISENLLERMLRGLKQRKQGQPVRLLYDQSMPDTMLQYFVGKLELSDEDNIIAGGRYHNFRDFMSFPQVEAHEDRQKPLPPAPHPEIDEHRGMFPQIAAQDYLFFYPYQRFDYFLRLLREAAIDPKVYAIGLTVYRLASDSKVANALINAAQNGKQVTVIIELQARFDEKANIQWTERLRDAGVRIILGVKELKVHSKLCQIHRREKGMPSKFSYINTGNFNEKTARLYGDIGLLTADREINREVSRAFDFFETPFLTGQYRRLLVSPFFMRRQFYELIDREIQHAREGREAWMIHKMNSLTDLPMIDKLYQASQAGVRIDLIVRGSCSLIPGVPGMSENIRAISIIDRFLEHARVFVFGNSGSPEYFIGSADWMPRNINRRVEVITPVDDPRLKQQLWDVLQLQLADNCKARILNDTQANAFVQASPDEPRRRSQIETHQYFWDYAQRRNPSVPSSRDVASS
mgnify:CR=1 FL=1